MRNAALQATVALLASHVTTTLAIPKSALFPRNDWEEAENDVDLWCGPSRDLREWDNAEEAFHRIRPDRVVQIMADRGEDDWLSELERLAFRDENRDRSGTAGCVDLDNDDCDPGDGGQCSKYFERNYESKLAFWGFRLVQGAHKKIARMYKQLDGETLSASLKLGSMKDDFDFHTSDDSISGGIMSLLSSGLALASAGAGAAGAGGAGAATSVMGTVLGGLSGASSDAEPISITEVEKGLGEAFDHLRDGLESIMKLATGDDSDGEFSDLPDLGDGLVHGIEHPIAKFFGHPFWLLDADSDVVDKVVSDFASSIKLKMVDIILQVGNWKIATTESRRNNKEQCDKLINHRLVEVDGEEYCFALHGRGDTPDSKALEPMEKYGIDIQEYFEIVVDCAKNGGSGENIDLSDIVTLDGGKPRCFYSLPVMKRKGRSGPNPCQGIKCYDLVDFFD